MKFSMVVLILTVFFMYNTYHDGKYTKMLTSWKKYYQMAFIGFAGLSLLVFMRKHPNESQSMLYHANSIIKFLPIEKGTADVLTPFFDFTKDNDTMNGQYGVKSFSSSRLMNSGKKSNKRCVSETKKKFVASRQNWTCCDCQKQLPAWFEVDHKVRLEHGGSNHIDNLEALCRDCHGKKTAMENL